MKIKPLTIKLLLLLNPYRVRVDEYSQDGKLLISWVVNPATARAILKRNGRVTVTRIYWTRKNV